MSASLGDVESLRAEVDSLRADAERYRQLRDSAVCAFSLSLNDHKGSYLSVAEMLDEPQGYYDGIDDSEREAMIATDTIWTLHVYEKTPVGFNVYHAASLDAVVDAAKRGPK